MRARLREPENAGKVRVRSPNAPAQSLTEVQCTPGEVRVPLEAHLDGRAESHVSAARRGLNLPDATPKWDRRSEVRAWGLLAERLQAVLSLGVRSCPNTFEIDFHPQDVAVVGDGDTEGVDREDRTRLVRMAIP